MKIRLDYLVNVLLKPLNLFYPRSDVPMVNLSQICLLTGNDQFDSSCLYIGYASQLPPVPPQTADTLTLLCIRDTVPDDAYMREKNICLLLCDESFTIQELFNQANTLFTGTLRSLDKLWIFLGKIADTSNFTELTAYMSQILDCPVALLSQSFKLLGHSDHPASSMAPSWSAMLRRRYFPHTDIINQIHLRGLTIFDPTTRKLIEDPTAAPTRGDAFFPLLSEDSKKEVLGFLYMPYNDREVLLTNRMVIQFLAYALTFRMWRYMNSPSNSNSALCFLMRDIISGAIIDNNEIARRLENIKFTPSKTTFLLVVYCSAMPQTQKYSWEHLKTVFGQLWPDDVLFTYNGDIIILVSSCKDTMLPEERTDQFTRLLAEHGCFGGISECFGVIDRSLRNYYVRTVAAAKMARSFNMSRRYTFYNDIALQHFVREGATIENPRDLCAPQILKLSAYDASHASSYIHTLQCYWHFNQDIQQTCDYLFIHRNTLFYRLKKVREIVDLDINNSKHLIQFNLSLSILTTLGDIPYNEFPPAGAKPSRAD